MGILNADFSKGKSAIHMLMQGYSGTCFGGNKIPAIIHFFF